MTRLLAGVLLLLALVPVAGWAEGRIDVLEFSGPEQQARYQTLVDQLRCPKCLNTNLAGSDAPIAADLRREVYRMVRSGMSEDEVREYLLERYGDFILYRPRLTTGTMALWFTPVLLLLLGAGLVWRISRSRAGQHTELTPEERARARSLLE